MMPENLLTPQLAMSPTTTLSTALTVQDLLVVLEAYHQRQSEKLQEICSGLTELNLDLLTQTALRLEAFTAPSRNEYLKVLTKHIMAVLDGGDGPTLPGVAAQRTGEPVLR